MLGKAITAGNRRRRFAMYSRKLTFGLEIRDEGGEIGKMLLLAHKDIDVPNSKKLCSGGSFVRVIV